MKRKRGSREATASKRKKAESGSKTESVTHPVLSQAHASLLSLRQWLGLRFCTGSRVQQRDATCSPAITSQDDKAQDEQVSEFLDNVVVGQNDELSVSVLDRKSAFRYFSQQLHSSAVGATGSSGGLNRTTMSEVRPVALHI